MPKLFRPKIIATATKTANAKPDDKSVQETQLPASSQTKLNGVHVTSESSPVPPLPAQQLPASPPPSSMGAHSPPTAKSPKVLDIAQPKSPPCSVASKSSRIIDIDQTTASKAKKQPRKSAPDREVVELFKPKKTRISAPKFIADPPPNPNQPLDRTTVSLRSLLNWVPANKPPPSYRQAQLKRENSVNEVVEKSESHSEQVDVKSDSLTSPAGNTTHSTTNVDLFAPQLRLDANGNIVIDEASLVISLPETARDDVNMRHVKEESGLLNVTYNSFRPQTDCRRGRRWSPQETVRFYRALSTFGRDFYLMAAMFPSRSRLELQRKFKSESRSNPYLVNQALRNRRTYDVTALIPISDDDEEEDEVRDERKIQNVDPAGAESVIEQARVKRKPGRRRRESSTSIRRRDQMTSEDRSGESHPGDSINATIDAVLAEYEQSLSTANATQSSEHDPDSSLPDSLSNMNTPSESGPNMRRGPVIQQMIMQARDRVEQCAVQLTVPDADKPHEDDCTTMHPPDEGESSLADEMTRSNASLDVLRVSSISEQSKIDILITGRRLLGE